MKYHIIIIITIMIDKGHGQEENSAGIAPPSTHPLQCRASNIPLQWWQLTEKW